jgi:uncharacterized protein (TIGR02466 family)
MIKNIFSTSIYETQFENYQNIKQEMLDKILPLIESKDENKHRLLMNSFSTANNVRDLHKKIDISVITDFVNIHVNEYWKAIGFSSMLKPYILHLWANKVPLGGNLASHNHNPNIMAGVFYISASPEMGNLLLEHPMEELVGRMPWENPKQQYLTFDHEIDVCDGKLVLFPGWLKHKTLINSTDNNRLVIGMNFGCAGPNIMFNEMV